MKIRVWVKKAYEDIPKMLYFEDIGFLHWHDVLVFGESKQDYLDESNFTDDYKAMCHIYGDMWQGDLFEDNNTDVDANRFRFELDIIDGLPVKKWISKTPFFGQYPVLNPHLDQMCYTKIGNIYENPELLDETLGEK